MVLSEKQKIELYDDILLQKRFIDEFVFSSSLVIKQLQIIY